MLRRAVPPAAVAALTTSLGLFALGANAPQARGATPAVKVQVDGVNGVLRDNVLGTLSIAKSSERKNASDESVRRLHARAEDEIRRALEPFGYYRPIIRAELITDRSPWRAHYAIEPGPPIRLDSVRVEVTGDGADDPGFQKRVAEFPLRSGDVLDHAAYAKGKAALESYAAEGGYIDAGYLENRIHVDLERYVAAIELRMDSGNQHRFGETLFDQSVLDTSMLAQFVTYRAGEVLDYRKLQQLQTDLSGTGYFSRVEVELRRELEHDDLVPVEVTLEPSRPERYTGGLGYATDDGGRIRGAVELRRLNRHGHRAQFEAQLAQLDNSVGGQYLVPWPNPRTDMITVSAGYQDIRTTVSTSGATHIGVSGSRLLGNWQAIAALNYRREKFVVGSDAGTARFLIPEGTWSRVRSDNLVITRGGDRVRLDLRGAQKSLGSHASFLQAQADGKVIYGLSPGMRAIARVQTGYTATSEFRRLPPTLRFFAGGSNSVRGYSYNSLGPRDAQGSVIGGKHLVVLSAEVDQLIQPRYGVAVFYDMGNAVNSLHRDPLKRGAGVGLRWYSPFGLIKGDVAWGLDRAGTPIQLHLQVGTEL